MPPRGAGILYIKNDNALYGRGCNGYGEFGNGGPITQNDDDYAVIVTSPIKIAANVAKVVCGNCCTLYLTKDGNLFSSGYNCSGQLGDGTQTSRSTFYHVADNVVDIAASYDVSYYLVGMNDARSIFSPTNTLGGKWSKSLQWIDDTYYPWVYSYTYDFWFYIYDNLDADINGFWMVYLRSNGAGYGWGYVYGSGGWWNITRTSNREWLNLWVKTGDPMLSSTGNDDEKKPRIE